MLHDLITVAPHIIMLCEQYILNPSLCWLSTSFKEASPDSKTLAVRSKSGIHSVYVKLHLGYRLDKESQPQYHCLHTYLKRRLTCFHGYPWHAWPKWPNLLTACMTRKILLEIKELEYPENSCKSATFSDCPQLGQTDTQGTVIKWNGPGVCMSPMVDICGSPG